MKHSLVFLVFIVLPIWTAAEEPSHDPARLLAEDDALTTPMQLPTMPGRTSVIHRACEGEWQYNLHSYLIHHDGQFWAMWSAAPRDEGARGQRIHYATSPDGHHWSEYRVMIEAPSVEDGPTEDGHEGLAVARGFMLHQGRLTALVTLMDDNIGGPDPSKRAWINLRLIRLTWDGEGWRNDGLYLDDCMNNYPPRPIRDRLFMTCRTGAAGRAMHTALANSAAGERWTITRLPTQSPTDRMSEPSWYVGPDGVVHLLFRDQNWSKVLHRSISRDNGVTWSAPVPTNYPDAVSKNFSGRLGDGRYYLISNPGATRDPLAISFSRDGWTFGDVRLVRKNAPAVRYEGRSKHSHTFQYPHAIEHNGSLWVIYATNKEDIEITECPLNAEGD